MFITHDMTHAFLLGEEMPRDLRSDWMNTTAAEIRKLPASGNSRFAATRLSYFDLVRHLARREFDLAGIPAECEVLSAVMLEIGDRLETCRANWLRLELDDWVEILRAKVAEIHPDSACLTLERLRQMALVLMRCSDEALALLRRRQTSRDRLAGQAAWGEGRVPPLAGRPAAHGHWSA